MTQIDKDQVCAVTLDLAIAKLRESKPNDRSETDRRYAVTITEMEKAYAYFMQYVMESETE